MPKAKKPVLPTERPEPINQYGFPVFQPHLQVTYDRAAMAFNLPVDRGCPPRETLFRRIADKLIPNYFEWHDWTKMIVNAGCNHRLIGNPGASNCVHGDTRILDAISGKTNTIQELEESGIAPTVMTLSGPQKASVPFVKGTDDLYEISLENGNQFRATMGHRVLASCATGHKYVLVGDLRCGQYLLSYDANHQVSTLESSPSIHASNVLGSRKIAANCPAGYSTDYRPLDGDFREGFSDNPFSRHSGLKTIGHAPQLFQHDEQFQPKTPRHLPFSKLHLGSVHTHSDFFGCAGTDILNQDIFQSFGYMVSPTKVVSIRRIGVGKFYDLQVPNAHHYFAEGTIHHNSGKTHDWAGFAAVWWLCYPEESSVMFVSTSIKSLRRRGWSEIQRCYSTMARPPFGNFVDSRMIWQAIKGDDKHAIIGKAVEEGSVHKVADDIKGVHTKRQMVVIDEATAVPEAIWEAVTNLYSYPREFILVALANPRDRLGRFSRFIEPLEGWTSVTVDTQEWEGKPQPEYGNMAVYVIRHDAERSPNITEGRMVSKHLPTPEKVAAARGLGGGQTPAYWTNFRGFPPPEGLTKTVFSESALYANNAFGKHVFTGRNFHIIGMFDPAFGGGDRPALRFAKLGEIDGGKWGIEAQKPIIIPLNPTSKNPVHFQLSETVRAHCEKVVIGDTTYSCAPENLAVDATGEGGGLCDIMQRTWSPRIIRIEFGGRASDDATSLEDVRPACEVYENKTTEMHFRTRDALNSGQLKGVDPETAIELCSREFDDSGKRIKLQKKKDYKEKFGKSPDFGDCLVGLSEVARRKGFRVAPVGQTVQRHQDWQRIVDTSQAVYSDVSYVEEEEILA